MPEIRSVSVRLDADVASYIAKIKAAGEATDRAFSSGPRNVGGFNSALSDTEKELGKVGTQARKVDTDMRRVSSSTDQATHSQDRFRGGVRILINTALALGPALVPIAAVGIPAIAGLTNELGSAVIGVGVAELAFHGLGKALSAFNKAELEPTTANIQAAQAAMAALPPSAQALVLELHKLSPVLDDLRQSAASGFLPGVTTGLRAVVTDAPVVEKAVHGIATELGDLTAQAGRALSGPEWRGFIRVVGQQTTSSLHEMGAATGDVVHGLAQLYLAFGPSLGAFDRGIVRVAADFDHWASSLDRTKGFQDFLDYIATNGPRVMSLLGDTADLLGSIVAAAAPLGGPTLTILDGIVKVLDAIAKSPLGTPLLLLAQLNAVLHLTNNLLGVMGVQARIGFTGITAGAAKAEAATEAESAAQRSQLSLMRSGASKVALGATGGAPFGLNPATGKSNALTDEESGALVTGGIQAAGIGLLASGAAQKMGLLNTTTLATIGLLRGPWTGAVAGAVGVGLDMKSAVDADAAAVQSLHDQVDSLTSSGNITGLSNLADAYGRIHAFATSQSGSVVGGTGGFLGTGLAGRIFGSQTTSIASKSNIATTAQSHVSTALNQFNTGLNGPSTPTVKSLTGLQQIATAMQPALAKLGLTLTDVVNTPPGQLPDLIDHLVKVTERSNDTVGSAHAVAKAFDDMSNSLLTPADRAQALTTALSNLIDPMLNLGSAHDAFQKTLNDMSKDLSKTTKSLVGNSDAAIQNREVIRGSVTALEAKIAAEAKAGASSEKMSATLRDGRQAIIQQGQAAGLNAGQIRHMIDVMNLTPHLIKTLIEADTGQAKGEVESYQQALANIPRSITTKVTVTRSTNANLAEQGVLSGPKKAGGGPVYGAGTSTSDSIPAWLSTGEFVMRASAVNHYGLGVMHAMNAGAYASGGAAGTTTTANVNVNVNDAGVTAGNQAQAQAAKQAAAALHGLHDESGRLTKQLQAEQAQRQKIQSARSSLVSTVRDQFRVNPFDTSNSTASIWAAGQSTDPLHVINQNIRQSRQFTQGLHRLRRRGLRGGALADVQTPAELKTALALSSHEDREISRRFEVLQRASQNAGATAGNFRFGKHLASIDSEIKETNRRLHGVEAAIKHHEAEAKKDSKANAAQVSGAISHTAQNVTRRAHHP